MLKHNADKGFIIKWFYTTHDKLVINVLNVIAVSTLNCKLLDNLIPCKMSLTQKKSSFRYRGYIIVLTCLCLARDQDAANSGRFDHHRQCCQPGPLVSFAKRRRTAELCLQEFQP